MCDQTEVTYNPGDVVWVKLGPVWWPGQVQDYDKLPEEITGNLRKKPIAVVKFFQEDSFEYVKNLNQIYQYNCRKKEEFIKKGLDLVRSSNSRDVPSNMKMFPNDIVMAEHLTGGDPNILENEVFAPEEKSDYSDLFGTKKSAGKKSKGDVSRKSEGWKSHKFSSSSNRRSLPTLPASVPRPITHPRFITKALEGRSDHEVRIRCQIGRFSNNEPEKKYNCHLCDFVSTRLNVIVLHNKSHSAGFIEAQSAMRARSKAKEKEHVTLIGDQTPTTVTSRGRVKSLPKKLMDYTDDPPPKIFKERIYKSFTKEESIDIKTPEKPQSSTPKRVKESSPVKSPVRKPLFGKRKTAREKAEIAKKQKQENEAMKETLLKDWDDDDVNEEEVELERLKQALESTTSSSSELDCSDSTIDNESFNSISESQVENIDVSLVNKNDDKPLFIAKDDIKAKVFEFDDTEDSLPININFRLKGQREKFTDDKFKKPKPPKPLVRAAKPKVLSNPPPPIEKKEVDKETIDFNEACNALLEETAVPVLPEIPNMCISTTTDIISDQTSDISSSTDLINDPDQFDKPDDQNLNMSDNLVDENNSDENLKMECTSSESEEFKSTELFNLESSSKIEADDQKNLNVVSACDPRVEMDVSFSPGVATTTTSEFTNSQLNTSANDSSNVCDDFTTPEISSTCDIAKTNVDETECLEKDMSDEVLHNSYGEVKHPAEENTTLKLDEVIDEDISKTFQSETMKTSEYIENTSNDSKDNTIETSSHNEVQNDSECNTPNIDKFSYSVIQEHTTPFDIANTLDVSQIQNSSDEIVKPKSNNVSKVEHISDGPIISNESSEILTQNVEENVRDQLVLPLDSEVNKSATMIKTNDQLGDTIQAIIPKLELSNSIQMETQNLQDMELDINSMPVIIGGEDFIQTEPPKQTLVPIQPKYSESIVISPKTHTQLSPSKTENVIMHLSEPSTSNQSIQSVIAIPNKTSRGGGRGVKTQKTTAKTIKLSASALKNLSSLQKGGNQQVLILKSAPGNQDKKEKDGTQKIKGPLNMVQHGNKFLIVSNPQLTGQNKIKLNPQQQQLLSGGKLAPGTKVLTSKIMATTTTPGSSVSTNKTSTSRASKPTQKLVISKGNIITNSSKSVIINNGAGKFITTVPGSITTSKGQTLITHNILNTKGGLILPSSSQNASSSGKTTTILTSQALSTSKGMILTPISGKGGTIISGNQKLRIVSSKASLSGSRLVLQNPQGKIAMEPQHKTQQLKLLSGLRGQSSGSTILIQTSQGLVAKPITSSITTSTAQSPIRATTVPKNLIATVPTQPKKRASTAAAKQPQLVHPTQIIQQSQIIAKPQVIQKPQPAPSAKKAVQRVRQSPNILQKGQRKSSQRGSKASANRLISPAVSTTETLILPTTSHLSTIGQPTLLQSQITQSSDQLVYLSMDESGNYRQVDKSLIAFDGSTPEAPQTIYIPADTQTQDASSIFLTIDNAGNIVNFAPPVPSTSFSSENIAPTQDILAKALANTQVLQQETILPDIDVSAALSSQSMDTTVLSNSAFNEQSQYPAPSLSHSVLETSLTLNQPIMTPLEVPSAVTPNIGQIPVSSNFLIAPKQKRIRPSMPLLTEDSLSSHTQGEQQPVFLLDGSNNIIPATSGSQISFHLTLDENNVIMTSGGSPVIPQGYQVVSGELLAPQLVAHTQESTLQKIDDVVLETNEGQENVTFNVLPQDRDASSEDTPSTHHSIILQEGLTEHRPGGNGELVGNNVNPVEGELRSEIPDDDQKLKVVETIDGYYSEQYTEEYHIDDPAKIHDVEIANNPLKRNIGEEETVSSSSDLEDSSKRIRLEER